ncbi:GNAT family N-acetyltransferase [Proteiniclasticum ruminis]|nr:GNAT family N-acetyltransferase [Proteiniclasticum ruminis]
MAEAVKLRISCWPEEVGGLSNVELDYTKEYAFWMDWKNRAKENNDVRLLYGVFAQEKMLGVAFGSFVESKEDPQHGVELNGLWVYPKHRGKGVSLILLKRLLEDFSLLGAKKMIIYNYHSAPSNQYYRKLGCVVVDNEVQTKDRILVDIFSGDFRVMNLRIDQSINRSGSIM